MGDRVDTARTEAFSDGVFAIAITLLVLEIAIPEEEFDDLWAALADLWPSYLAYVTSFLTIGALWLGHHSIFRRLRRVDATLLRLNLALLMVVAFLPFPTSLMARALTTDAERPAVLLYGATVLAIATLMTAIARYAVARADLLADEAARVQVRAIAARTAPSLGFYGLVLLLALLAPDIAAFGFVVVAILALAPLRPQ
jgi:uncharacterized membrane protein